MNKITFIAILVVQLCISQAPQLAYDIYPGQNSSVPTNPVLFGADMYFSAYFSGFGSELTRFDGTNMPVRVADVYEGFNSSMTEVDPIVFNDKIYFTATDGSHGYELWVYDGVNPTAMVLDIRTGSASSFPDRFVVYNDKLYFYANDGVNGGEIWQYDGINPPTMLLDMFVGTASSSSLADHFCVYNGKLYFSAKDSSAAAKIWQYDGLSMPTQVFPNHIAPSYIIAYAGKMYLGSYNTVTSAVQYLNYDGTDLNIETNITGRILADLNGTVYFFNSLTIGTYGYEIWKYDGVSPPVIAADVNPGAASSNPSCVTAYNNKIYFVADDGTHGYEVWTYDGTSASLTGEITPTIIDPGITFMQVFNGKLYFNANNGAAAGQQGSELWTIEASLSTGALNENTALLYPNPVDGPLDITSATEFDAVSLYDINGRTIFTEHFSPTKNTQISLNLPAGFYAIVLVNDGVAIFGGKLLMK
jgi:trimeric autotransporter adhesin